jgi:hypothetical protein
LRCEQMAQSGLTLVREGELHGWKGGERDTHKEYRF